MKNIIKSILFFILTICTLFFSCVSNSRLKASNAKILQLQKDSIATANKLALQNAAIIKQKAVAEEKAVIPEKTVVKDVDFPKTDFVPFPPDLVLKKFKTAYPNASDVFWFRDNAILNTNQTPNKVYKVKFNINKEKNSLIYDEDGDILETRVQILPAQLPPNIYQAIKVKHPAASILSAETYRNKKNSGTYSAIIKPTNGLEQQEVILTEKGVFVEK